MKKIFLTIISVVIIATFVYSQDFSKYNNDFTQKYPKLAKKFSNIEWRFSQSDTTIVKGSVAGDVCLRVSCTKLKMNWEYEIHILSLNILSEPIEYMNEAIIKKILNDIKVRNKKIDGNFSFSSLRYDNIEKINFHICYIMEPPGTYYYYSYNNEGVFVKVEKEEMNGE